MSGYIEASGSSRHCDGHLAGARAKGAQESVEIWTVKEGYTALFGVCRGGGGKKYFDLSLSHKFLPSDFHCLNPTRDNAQGIPINVACGVIPIPEKVQSMEKKPENQNKQANDSHTSLRLDMSWIRYILIEIVQNEGDECGKYF